MSPILTVVGATGVQGSSIVESALEAGGFKVRAITRNVNSEKAKALAARGVEVVAADLDDLSSLIAAFSGSTYIFAVTNFFEPFFASGPEEAMRVEQTQGINLAKAAAATTTLKHYIWSTLPNGSKISGGKYVIPHFEAKNRIDEYIKSDAQLLAKTTFLWVTLYATNYGIFPVFIPNLLKSSGKYVQLQPAAPSTPIRSIGDAGKNTGAFVLAILGQPQLTLGGRYVIAETDRSTTGELLKTWGKVTGKDTVYVRTTVEEYDAAWPMLGREMGTMMEFWNEFGDRSWTGEDLVTGKMLGLDVTKLGGIKEAFESMDWSTL